MATNYTLNMKVVVDSKTAEANLRGISNATSDIGNNVTTGASKASSAFNNLNSNINKVNTSTIQVTNNMDRYSSTAVVTSNNINKIKTSTLEATTAMNTYGNSVKSTAAKMTGLKASNLVVSSKAIVDTKSAELGLKTISKDAAAFGIAGTAGAEKASAAFAVLGSQINRTNVATTQAAAGMSTYGRSVASAAAATAGLKASNLAASSSLTTISNSGAAVAASMAFAAASTAGFTKHTANAMSAVDKAKKYMDGYASASGKIGIFDKSFYEGIDAATVSMATATSGNKLWAAALNGTGKANKLWADALGNTNDKLKDTTASMPAFTKGLLTMAATTMVLRTAWNLLKLGADFKEQSDILDNLTAKYKTSTAEIVAAMKKASDSLISNSALMGFALSGIAKGLKPEQLINLAKAATAFSDIVGEDATTAMRSLTEAIETGRTRGLKRYIGTTMDLEEEFGDLYTKMTDLEKAQAAYSVTMIAYTKLQAEQKKEVSETANSVERLAAMWENLKLAVAGSMVGSVERFGFSDKQDEMAKKRAKLLKDEAAGRREAIDFVALSKLSQKDQMKFLDDIIAKEEKLANVSKPKTDDTLEFQKQLDDKKAELKNRLSKDEIKEAAEFAKKMKDIQATLNTDMYKFYDMDYQYEIQTAIDKYAKLREEAKTSANVIKAIDATKGLSKEEIDTPTPEIKSNLKIIAEAEKKSKTLMAINKAEKAEMLYLEDKQNKDIISKVIDAKEKEADIIGKQTEVWAKFKIDVMSIQADLTRDTVRQAELRGENEIRIAEASHDAIIKSNKLKGKTLAEEEKRFALEKEKIKQSTGDNVAKAKRDLDLISAATMEANASLLDSERDRVEKAEAIKQAELIQLKADYDEQVRLHGDSKAQMLIIDANYEAKKKAAAKKAAEDSKGPLQKWAATYKETTDLAQEWTIQVYEKMTDGIVDAAWEFVEGTKSMKQAFLDFAKSFMKEMTSMILKQAMLNAVKKAYDTSYTSGGSSGSSGGGGSTGGLISGIIGWAMSAFGGGGGGGVEGVATTTALGGAFYDGKMLAYAKGGIVDKPTMFAMKDGMGLMGEAGPEAVVPLKRMSGGRLGVSYEGDADRKPKEEKKQQVKLEINNISSPEMIERFLTSPRGQNSIMNVVGSNSNKISKMLRI